jgi:hypothetical protein
MAVVVGMFDDTVYVVDVGKLDLKYRLVICYNIPCMHARLSVMKCIFLINCCSNAALTAWNTKSPKLKGPFSLCSVFACNRPLA